MQNCLQQVGSTHTYYSHMLILLLLDWWKQSKEVAWIMCVSNQQQPHPYCTPSCISTPFGLKHRHGVSTTLGCNVLQKPAAYTVCLAHIYTNCNRFTCSTRTARLQQLTQHAMLARTPLHSSSAQPQAQKQAQRHSRILTLYIGMHNGISHMYTSAQTLTTPARNRTCATSSHTQSTSRTA